MLQENLIRIYEQSFRDNRELPALTDYFKKETFSYYEMAKEIAKLHMLFEQCGVKRGDKIALIGRNNPRWVITYIATITYGAIIVPILQDFNPNDINHIINHSESKLLFLGDAYWDVIDEDRVLGIEAAFSLTDYRCIFEREGDKVTSFQKNIVKHYRTRYPRGFSADDIKYPEVGNDEVCVISYTSGSTGFSKGVMLTVNNLTMQLAYVLPKRYHFRGSRVLCFLPLAHVFGCAIDMLCSLGAGTHVTLLGKIPSPKILVEALAEVRPNVICSVPMIIEKLVKKQIFPMIGSGLIKTALQIPLIDNVVYSSIRKKLVATMGGEFLEFVVGGAALNPEVEEFLHRIKFPITVGYGMTECGPLISHRLYTDGYVPTSAGRVLTDFCECRILSPDPAHIPGEILIRGEQVMKGYYKNPEATAAVLDEDGWLHTGDMGTVDADMNIFLRGRSKTMILMSGGQNVYPEEIEAKLNNLAYVLESLVVARENKLVALVVPDYEQLDAAGIPHSKLEEIMNETLKELNTLVASYEKVAYIELRPTEFEKTPKKSIKRFLYR
ncbi:MAG: AMP-binding protein [Tidjanibacter sp.]|nr:AMP-binding protein [Tidjanibacter sp.]